MYDSIKIVLSEKDLNNEISFMEVIQTKILSQLDFLLY